MTTEARTSIRLAEVLAALSLETDLAMGHAPEQAMRACVVSVALASRAGLGPDDVRSAYFTTLLRYVGCTAFAHEEAVLFGGDDVAVRRGGARVDFGDPRDALGFMLVRFPRELPAGRRARMRVTALTRGRGIDRPLKTANCEVASRTAERLDLDDEIVRGLYEMFERWDGKGAPKGLSGDAISLASRVANVACLAALFGASEPPDAVAAVMARRAGGALDPELAGLAASHARDLLAEADDRDAWEAVLRAEPEPHVVASERHIDRVARAFADVVDLKSPFLHGHSAGVAALAERAAAEGGLPSTSVANVRRAGLLHDLGRVGVATGTWEQPGALSTTEWEAVRLHAYHTERILSRSPALAGLAPIAGQHHERLDGSGYHRGSPAAIQPIEARLLAASDVFEAMTAARPHRPALAAPQAADALEEEARRGRLDPEAVRWVLAASGRTGRGRAAYPAGLSEREVEVLRLLAAGMTKKQVAARLFIAPSTVHTHALHIYDKAGVSTRAGVALFAMEHGLIRD